MTQFLQKIIKNIFWLSLIIIILLLLTLIIDQTDTDRSLYLKIRGIDHYDIPYFELLSVFASLIAFVVAVVAIFLTKEQLEVEQFPHVVTYGSFTNDSMFFKLKNVGRGSALAITCSPTIDFKEPLFHKLAPHSQNLIGGEKLLDENSEGWQIEPNNLLKSKSWTKKKKKNCHYFLLFIKYYDHLDREHQTWAEIREHAGVYKVMHNTQVIAKGSEIKELKEKLENRYKSKTETLGKRLSQKS